MRGFVSKALALTVSTALVPVAFAQDVHHQREFTPSPKEQYSPYVDDHYPKDVYFGDTHLHTAWSTDVGMIGASLGPEAAYRIASGGEVKTYMGWNLKLIRPLDFIVVADHAENLGLADFIERSDPLVLANPVGKKWHDMTKAGNGYDAFLEWLRADNKDLINEPKMTQAIWARVVENADKYYKPGVFTTFHGFEWTSHPDGNNMHRVVMFRDNGSRTSQVLPFSQYDSVDAEDLWDYLADYENKTGGQVLAIPHNGNFSNGLMFDDKTYSGKVLSKAYAETRMKWEPVIEVTQQKGDSETHPMLSPNDEFADFETVDKGNLSGKFGKTPDMLPKEYARSALKRGLAYEQELGANPFKFGMVGSTDNHTALPTAREDNNWSKIPTVEPNPDRIYHPAIKGAREELTTYVREFGAAGLAAAWATENTREAIWDAFARKEVYATTGNRMKVRFFAGWDFESADMHRPDFADHGYKHGVPMGGDLTAAPRGKAPTFIIRALRDSEGPNIDRIQVIKGWVNRNGDVEERIYDVAVSDDRNIVNGRCETPVGSTVDIANASYSNSIGEPLMVAYWQDPDFDAKRRAFYYVRVIEIPTPRWTAYDVKFFGITDIPEGTQMVVQDRAYTSPVWYTP